MIDSRVDNAEKSYLHRRLANADVRRELFYPVGELKLGEHKQKAQQRLDSLGFVSVRAVTGLVSLGGFEYPSYWVQNSEGLIIDFVLPVKERSFINRLHSYVASGSPNLDTIRQNAGAAATSNFLFLEQPPEPIKYYPNNYDASIEPYQR